MQVVRDIRCNKHKHKQVVRDQILDALSSFPQRFEEKTLTLSLHNQWQKLFGLVENENYCSSSDWLLQFPPALKSPWEVDWPKELPQMPEEEIKPSLLNFAGGCSWIWTYSEIKASYPKQTYWTYWSLDQCDKYIIVTTSVGLVQGWLS